MHHLHKGAKLTFVNLNIGAKLSVLFTVCLLLTLLVHRMSSTFYLASTQDELIYIYIYIYTHTVGVNINLHVEVYVAHVQVSYVVC